MGSEKKNTGNDGLFEIVKSERKKDGFTDCRHHRRWYGSHERAQAVFRHCHQIIEVDCGGGFQPALWTDDYFRRNPADGRRDWGDGDVMKMADDVLSGQDKDRTAVIGARKAKLPNFAAIYFGHVCAFRTGANSLRLMGWRA